jgi:putative ABC transport system permease protein
MSAPAWMVRGTARGYAAMLRLVPRHLRERYGDDMRQTFEAHCRDAAVHGTLALVALLWRDLADLLRVRVRAMWPPSTIAHRPSALSPQPSAMVSDIRYAVRMLIRQPAFTAVAVLTLGLGIGANTAVFTVVNGVLLRPLPYGDPDSIVVLLNGRSGRMSTAYSPLNYFDITKESGVFAAAAAFSAATANLTGRGDPQRVDGADVMGGFFTVLGITPRLGRPIAESDVASDAPVIVVSDGFWRRELGGRADAIGSTIVMDGRKLTVVGVAPGGLTLPRRAEFWRPLMLSPDSLNPRSRGAQFLSVVARLRPGVDVRQANSAMAAVAGRLAEAYPNTNKDRQMIATPLHEQMVQNVRPALFVLVGAVMVVLLIACVNVANLLLARAHARTREVAVRAALGAGRRRLIQQFLAESLVLGLAGGSAGLLVAFWFTRVLVALGPTSIPRLADVAIDWRVLGFTVVTAVTTSVLFGLAPAAATSGGSMARFIIGAGRGTIGSGGTRTRKVLVVCEMALAVVLLVGAGLLVRSYSHIIDVNPGFSADRVLTFHLALPDSKFRSQAAVTQLTAAYVDRLEHTAGVESAAAIMGLPLDTDFTISSSFRRTGEPDSADTPSAGMRIITPGYFKTMKIPLKAGRTFDARDNDASPEVVIINEQAARRFWPDSNPIGQEIRLGVRLVRGIRSGQKTIVGIVGDVKYGSLDANTPPEVYLPHAQHPVGNMTIAVRTAGDPLAFVPTARAQLAAVDPELPLADIYTMNDLVGRSVAERRFMMLLLAAFATIAVALAAIGVYGVLAYVVTQRTPEIGVRLAMGAAPADVVRLFVREGAMLTIVGLAAGLAGAAAATRALTTLLFGVSATDPTTFAGVAALLLLIALMASYVPARRAARVDPMTALRAD